MAAIELNEKELKTLCSATNYRLRFLDDLIRNEKEYNPGMVDYAIAERDLLQGVFYKLWKRIDE